jgi:uracil-DNA glycosylase
MNVANYKTFNNKPLNKQLINLEIPRLKAFLKGRVVVTLGDTAWKAVQRASNEDVGVLATVAPLPHPSGRNRKLNDKELIKQQLQFAKYIIDGARR